MANQDWYDLGDQIKRIVQDAVDSKDFRTLNKTINSTINDAAQNIGKGLKNATSGGRSRYSGQNKYNNPNWSFPYGRARDDTASGPVNPPAPRPKVNDHKGAGLALSVTGGVFTGVFGLSLFITTITNALRGTLFTPLFLVPICIIVPLFLTGIVLASVGSKKYGKAKRFRLYMRTLKDKTYCNLKELENLTGKSHSFLLKELKNMIRIGWFPEGHLDEEGTCLITSDETYDEYLNTLKYQAEQQKQKNAEASAAQNMPEDLREIIKEGKTYIRQIHAANDAIPGEEISNKISRMELLIQRIFQHVEQHPEVIPDLRKLMEYYLPTTIKLLDAYEELDAQQIQGENILSSKHEIEITIDTLNLAFEKLLDSLFKDVAWDISSDISVLHTMLAQEGLTKDDFS